jgi:imidazole glycerol-phosphate synthase subunit HisH
VIALIDYGAGNLTSVKKALTFLGADFVVPSDPDVLREARGIIVPGVGNFAATAALAGAWYDAIATETSSGKPLLGICLGMQWLFEGSDEAPEVRGLGVVKGRITRLRGDAERQLKIPHVGWNSLEFRSDRPQPFDKLRVAPSGVEGQGSAPSRLLHGIEVGSQVYFTHSYAAPVTTDCVAATTHCSTFASVVERDNVFGVQFHPEKSSDAGLQMLRNFLKVCDR